MYLDIFRISQILRKNFFKKDSLYQGYSFKTEFILKRRSLEKRISLKKGTPLRTKNFLQKGILFESELKKNFYKLKKFLQLIASRVATRYGHSNSDIPKRISNKTERITRVRDKFG